MWKIQIWRESDHLEGSWDGVFALRSALSPQHYPLLAGLDREGETCFNRRQSRRLIGELRSLSSRQMEDAQAAQSLAGFVEESMRRVHRYIWFVPLSQGAESESRLRRRARAE